MGSYIFSLLLLIGIIRFSAKTKKEVNNSYFWRYLSIINKQIKIIYSDWWKLAKKIKTTKANHKKILIIILGYAIRKYLEELKTNSIGQISNLEEFTNKLIESIDFYEINSSSREVVESIGYQEIDSHLDKIKEQVKIQSKGLIQEIEKQLNIKLSESAMLQLTAIDIFVIDFKEKIKELNSEINSEILEENKKRFSTIKFILLVSLGLFVLLFSWWNYLTYTKSQNGYITIEDRCLEYYGDDCESCSHFRQTEGNCDCMCVKHSYKTISTKEKTIEDLPNAVTFSLVGGVATYLIYLSKKENS